MKKGNQMPANKGIKRYSQMDSKSAEYTDRYFKDINTSNWNANQTKNLPNVNRNYRDRESESNSFRGMGTMEANTPPLKTIPHSAFEPKKMQGVYLLIYQF